ncbi:hypothetical protein [Paraburkholderia rhynchosiae]|uniref:hypothetical protein n=1 Tax=Paraburkholderia rhynchosiae TaxID=487049 RepID=UPI0038B77ED2
MRLCDDTRGVLVQRFTRACFERDARINLRKACRIGDLSSRRYKQLNSISRSCDDLSGRYTTPGNRRLTADSVVTQTPKRLATPLAKRRDLLSLRHIVQADLYLRALNSGERLRSGHLAFERMLQHERDFQVGSTAALLGHPLRSLVAAARLAAQAGEPLQAGSIVMAGGATPAEWLKPGQYVSVDMEQLGSAGFHVKG